MNTSMELLKSHKGKFAIHLRVEKFSCRNKKKFLESGETSEFFFFFLDKMNGVLSE